MPTDIFLEPEAQAFVDLTANPPYQFDLGPIEGRILVDESQAGDVPKPDADIEDMEIPGGPSGKVSVRIVRPPHSSSPLPAILYLHGGGWVFCNKHTHDRLIREIATRVGAALVFPNYSLSPEAKYPTAIEECYAALEWIAAEGSRHAMDTSQIAVAGDSAGGNMTAVMTILAKERRGPEICQQLLFYPATNASVDSDSYQQFETGYFLRRDAMVWFWEQYLTDVDQRKEITVSPLRATTDYLRGLPRAMVVTAEADVLRDEGEAYANKLRRAGVEVTAMRMLGTIHDFMMVNSMATSRAAQTALSVSCDWLREGFDRGSIVGR